jgi:predicted DsbA family dithiol-disulfide isomerase
MMADGSMHIDVWSDLVCPWCYVGKRRFERALTGFDHQGEVQVAHRSFQLNPAFPRQQTSPRRDALMAKYQLSEAQAQAMDEKMERTAAAEGLEYHLGGGLTGNTFDAHQLVQAAGRRRIQDAVIERFYRAYFTEQRSLFDAESLVQLAGEAGLDRAEAREVLETNAYAAAVTGDIQRAKAIGVTGVPFFVVDGRYAISGAQPTELFLEALQRAWAERQPQ